MSIRAKFRVESIEDSADVDGRVFSRRITLRAVYSDDPAHENRAFWQATPTGFLDMSITNPAAFEQFERGAEYYIDFERADGPR